MSDKAYKVNLPVTDFPMKANSVVREVETQKFWDDNKIYEKSLQRRSAAEKFVLHDGPPYLSSSQIHIGTALNKILKDIVTKYKTLRGFYSPYVPGYDSHGLPIETAVLKDVKGGRAALSTVELRKRCREFALKNLKGQEENFRRLGVWGDWAHPYITLDKLYEAAEIRVFGKMATAGYLYKGLKSISWCPNCETALAEAEIEYAEHLSNSIYVKFKVEESSRHKLPDFVPGDQEVNFVIWTTTPWTLPANLGVAVHPQFEYQFLLSPTDGVLVVATDLKDDFINKTGLQPDSLKLLGTTQGKTLEFVKTKHPFMDRPSLVILGEHVTAEAGTGVVHTAPGHGPEDFEIGHKYKLGVLSPVDGRGIFNDEAGKFAGMRFDKANLPIVEHLKELGRLLHHSTYSHSYPHCWRCKKPLIFRATEQWFASVNGCRDQALAAIDAVEWIPASGRNRIYAMVQNRNDWCISRQRVWGVPIPVFYCQGCGKHLMTAASIERVAAVFAHDGSDSWWQQEASHFLGTNFPCANCGGTEYIKETDTMDVWFDSGSSHASVLDVREELRGAPCELYLEGSDQHRGWFQSSLLTSVAVHDRAPYKTVLTHGFVVDESGRKMSKSVGNFVDPNDVIKHYGADVLRLWVASVNYTDDIPIGKNMLAQLAEVYKKLRNTLRFILGNLADFDPATDRVSLTDLSELDAFVLHRLNRVIEEVTKDFDRFEFFKYYQVLQNFCNVDLSSFYLDIAKDRLYTAAPKSLTRRAVQTVLEELLQALVRILVPVTPHLAEDIWQHIPEKIKTAGSHEMSVLMTDYPVPNPDYYNHKLETFWTEMITVRGTVNKALEQARASRQIGSSLEAQVFVSFDDSSLSDRVAALGSRLPSIFITSQATVPPAEGGSGGGNGSAPEVLAEVNENGMKVKVLKAQGEKCPRCWKYSTKIGIDAAFPELCNECAEAVGATT